MPTHQSAASAINLVDEENEQVPRPVEAEALPSADRVEQTFGADLWRMALERRGSR